MGPARKTIHCWATHERDREKNNGEQNNEYIIVRAGLWVRLRRQIVYIYVLLFIIIYHSRKKKKKC